jgi:hypothetical protein
MTQMNGCQIPGYQRITEGNARDNPKSVVMWFKRTLAKPWNFIVKPRLKRIVKTVHTWRNDSTTFDKLHSSRTSISQSDLLAAGDLVRVRDRKEIEAALDPFNELRGCAFLEDMWQYCGSTQRVLKPVERFLDERDYKVKKAKGVVLLEGILCSGTPVFGRCDRACHLFWRVEWLEKVEVRKLTQDPCRMTRLYRRDWCVF